MKTRVKELRTAAKMTQQQLADLVHVRQEQSSRSKRNNTARLLCLLTEWRRYLV